MKLGATKLEWKDIGPADNARDFAADEPRNPPCPHDAWSITVIFWGLCTLHRRWWWGGREGLVDGETRRCVNEILYLIGFAALWNLLARYALSEVLRIPASVMPLFTCEKRVKMKKKNAIKVNSTKHKAWSGISVPQLLVCFLITSNITLTDVRTSRSKLNSAVLYTHTHFWFCII